MIGVGEVRVYRRRDRGQSEDVGHLRRPSQGPEVRLRKVRFEYKLIIPKTKAKVVSASLK